MGWICKNCGNEDSFNAVQLYDKTGREHVKINNEEDIEDYGDTIDEDTESTSIEDVSCYECESEDVEYTEDEDELIQIRKDTNVYEDDEPTSLKDLLGV